MEKSKISRGRIGDISQHGNWSNFRNEVFNDVAIEITSGFCKPLPVVGKLSFDYIGFFLFVFLFFY
jgi:hypothetical protein